jgi:F0F1-type ATP synthase beta subunit
MCQQPILPTLPRLQRSRILLQHSIGTVNRRTWHLPAVDPLALHQERCARSRWQEHYEVAAATVQRVLQRYKDLQDIIAILEWM